MDNIEVRLNMYHPSRANMGAGSVKTLANILMPKNDAIAFVENLNPKETFSLPKSKERYILMCSPISVRTIENPTQFLVFYLKNRNMLPLLRLKHHAQRYLIGSKPVKFTFSRYLSQQFTIQSTYRL